MLKEGPKIRSIRNAVRPVAAAALLTGLMGTAAQAQSVIGYLNPFGSERGGLKVYSVSLFGGYFSGGLPGGLGFQSSALSNSQDPSGITGASATIGWSRRKGDSNLSAVYSGSYITQVPDPKLHSFNHSFNLGLSGSRRLSARWRGSFGITANLVSQDTFLYAPTQLSTLASVPATFDELSAAVLTGKYGTNSALATVLTGATSLDTALRPFFYGYRTLSTSATGGLSYSYSPRLTISVTASGTRSQHLSSDNNADATYEYLVPHTTSGGASVSISYSLSPKTQVSIGGSATRTFSSYQDAYYANGSAGISHTIAHSWFVQASAGAGSIYTLRTTYLLPPGAQYTVSGGVGYRSRSHSILGNVSRSIGDQYGYGAGSTLTAGGAWTWSRPGLHWSTFASMSMQRLTGYNSLSFDGWRGSVGISRVFGPHFAMNAQYSYITYVNPVRTNPDLTQNGVFLALIWSPQRIR